MRVDLGTVETIPVLISTLDVTVREPLVARRPEARGDDEQVVLALHAKLLEQEAARIVQSQGYWKRFWATRPWTDQPNP
jgi:hypothetical protein